MIRPILAAILLLVSTTIFSADLIMPIVGDVDGDTIKTKLNIPCPLCNVSIRIRGVDTPEKGARAQCPAEALLALKATEFTKQLIGDNKTMTVSKFKWDKYGGRIDGIVIINGLNVADELIKNQLAVTYDGGKKRSWCK